MRGWLTACDGAGTPVRRSFRLSEPHSASSVRGFGAGTCWRSQPGSPTSRPLPRLLPRGTHHTGVGAFFRRVNEGGCWFAGVTCSRWSTVVDALDRAELTIAREEDDYVPWEQVKAELGLA